MHKKNNHEINLTDKQKHLYSHRLQDIEAGLKSHLTLTWRVTQAKSHNDLRLNIFNCKMDTNPVYPPRAVKLQGNTYLGPGVGVSLGASPWSQMGLDKDEDKKKKKILVLCQGGKPPPFQISEWGLRCEPWTTPQKVWSLPGKNLLSGPGSSMMWCCSLSSPGLHQAKSSWDLEVY